MIDGTFSRRAHDRRSRPARRRVRVRGACGPGRVRRVRRVSTSTTDTMVPRTPTAAWAQSAPSTTPATASTRTRSSPTSTVVRCPATRRGRTVREYQFVAAIKEIEVAPGVFFEAWTYNGRVPGPTIRATQGDRIRIELVNASPHPHTIHFHGIHPAAMDGVPGAGEVGAGRNLHLRLRRRVRSAPTCTTATRSRWLATSTAVCTAHSSSTRQVAGRRRSEMVIVLNAFDTNFDGENEVYAANTIAFAYFDEPIPHRRRASCSGPTWSTSPSSTRSTRSTSTPTSSSSTARAPGSSQTS